MHMNTISTYEQIMTFRKKLKSKLDPIRYEHTLSVSYTCMNLAMRYGADLQKAELAGLLHDCAKRFTDQELIARCRKHDIELTEWDLRAPAVIHAKNGAWLAQHKFGIEDDEILEAIRCHTTGKPGMGLLDKILYIADYIEPRRYKAADLPRIRQLAYQDLDQGLNEILDGTQTYLEGRECVSNPLSRQTFEYYQSQKENGEAENKQTESKPTETKQTEKGGTEYGTGKRNGKAGYKRPGRQKGRGRSRH